MNTRKSIPPIVFVTGTGTGVGKTLLSALLLRCLRGNREADVRAMKPVSAGDRGDGELLRACEGGGRELNRVNPWHFALPASPHMAARAEGRRLTFDAVTRRILAEAMSSQGMIVEGAGGLMVPLTAEKLVVDLIRALNCDRILVVAVNRLGVLNEVLLTVNGLPESMRNRSSVVLMSPRIPDVTTGRNAEVLRRFLPGKVAVTEMPWMGSGLNGIAGIRRVEKKIQKTLARLCEVANLHSLFGSPAL